MDGSGYLQFPAILNEVQALLPDDRPVYLVGGAVRDLLLGKTVHDLDFVLPGAVRPLARRLADRLGAAFYMLDEERDTARLVLRPADGPQFVLDFATLRAADLESDLRARDFTINAMALDLAHRDRLIDPLSGAADLQARRLRACSPTALTDDPLRVLRGVRMALSFQMRILPDTLALIKAAVPLLPRVSAERQRDELFRLLEGRQVAAAVRILDQLGILPVVLPELPTLKGVEQSAPHVLDVWEHSLAVVGHLESVLNLLAEPYREEQAGASLVSGLITLELGRFRQLLQAHFAEPVNPLRSRRSLLMLAALLHDVAKPQSRTVEAGGRTRFLGHDQGGAELAVQRGRALMLSLDELHYLDVLTRQHMRVHLLTSGEALSRRAIYRFFRASGPAGVDLCLLALADLLGVYGATLPQDLLKKELEVCRALLDAYWNKPEQVVNPPRLLNGGDLIRVFNMQPGRKVGALLEALAESQAAGELSDQEQALQFARHWLDENGVN